MKHKATITGAYLHSDGHCVIVYEKTVRTGQAVAKLEYCEIYEKFCPAHLGFTGRLVFHRYHAGAFLELAKISSAIRCDIPSLDRGSDNTKRLGIAVSDLEFTIKGSSVSIPFFVEASQLPYSGNSYGSLCSNGITYQPECRDNYANTLEKSEWGRCQIATRHPSKVQTPAIA